jgi:LPPG:FO 2-phospho-L-lactate transferase
MTAHRTAEPKIIALCGGIGGAKLAFGLDRILDEDLTVVVNTGDDFEHLGLHVSPDIDTVIYTLAGLNDTERGWGRAGETWAFMKALAELGGETWFNLGDLDLAMHVERTSRLNGGATLTDVTRVIGGRLGIRSTILPASDQAIRTVIETNDGPLAFQHYFVRERCEPKLTGIRYEGSDTATVSGDVVRAFGSGRLAAVIVCPSNPFLSIDPILAVSGMRDLIATCDAPVIAVSPIVGGAAVKGPTAKIMQEMSVEVSHRSIADHYRGLIDALVVDEAGQGGEEISVRQQVCQTLMTSQGDKVRLAEKVLRFAATLSGEPRRRNAQ